MRALAALLVLVSLATPAAGLASEARPTQNELESEIMCPVCGTTVDQSDAAAARNIKQFIAVRIAAGDTKGEIKDELVASFGEEVLAAPPKEGFNLLAWLLPLVAVAVAIPIVGYGAWRWSQSRNAGRDDPPRLDPELERRVDQELARFDAS